MEEIAYAKINLALHVREREADGYHRIETIFAFCEEGDVLLAREGEGIELSVTGPFAACLGDPEDNLVASSRAARCGIGSGVHLELDKRLPVASGIGGGSADAAAALRLLSRFRKLESPPLAQIAAALGADVPACLASRTALGESRGDALRPLDPGLSGAPVLLVNPGVPLSTAEVFGNWEGIDRGPLEDWEKGRNDLEPAARRLVPQIGEVLDALRDARIARMSGSGATCFGLYSSEAERDSAVTRIAALHPEWWLLPSRLRK